MSVNFSQPSLIAAPSRRGLAAAIFGRWGGPGGRGGWALAAGGIALLVALPILGLLASFRALDGSVWLHLAATVLPGYVSNTLLLMAGVGAGTAILGVACAWLVTLCRFPFSRALEWALLLPMAFPAYVLAYAYTGLMDFAGPVQGLLRALTGWQGGDYWFPQLRSMGGAIAMMTLVLYPYVYMLARAAFLEQSVCVLEASRTLGCSPRQAFFRVALPLARPAVAGGVALALMEALNDFGTVQYFAVDTFTTGIYRTWLGLGQFDAAAQLALVLLIFVIVLLAVERSSRARGGIGATSTRYRELPRFRLRGWRAGAALTLCLLPVILGFVLPLALFVYWVAGDPALAGQDWLGRLVPVTRNSVILAMVAALLVVGLAMVVAYAQRLAGQGPLGAAVAIAARFSGLGYAMPGTVIAVGLLAPLTLADTALAGLLERLFGIDAGLLLTGTAGALLFAYVVRFLAVAANPLEAGLARITASMDHAARSLGRGPFGAFRAVHAPLIRPSLLTAGLLVFVDVMKELPATLLLRPFNFDTLAVQVYQLASDERLAESAPGAIAIVAVGILPVLLLSRAIARGRPGHAGGAD